MHGSLGSTLCMDLMSYADQDLICANFICNVRITGSYHLEDVITCIACNYFIISISLAPILVCVMMMIIIIIIIATINLDQ